MLHNIIIHIFTLYLKGVIPCHFSASWYLFSIIFVRYILADSCRSGKEFITSIKCIYYYCFEVPDGATIVYWMKILQLIHLFLTLYLFHSFSFDEHLSGLQLFIIIMLLLIFLYKATLFTCAICLQGSHLGGKFLDCRICISLTLLNINKLILKLVNSHLVSH